MDELFTFRLTPQHRQALEKLSDFYGEDMSKVIRTLIREKAEDLHIWPMPTVQNESEKELSL